MREENKVMVSGVENPFYFPSDARYRVGHGRVLGERAVVMNVTDRNFGMYPVFVFTTDGIFVLSSGAGEEAHGSVTVPVWSEEAVSEALCETPYGVVFVGREGVMIVNQGGVALLSGRLGRRYRDFHKQGTDLPKEALWRMWYNEQEEELNVVRAKGKETLVYSFRTKMWHGVDGRDGVPVENSYPGTYALWDGKALYDMTEGDETRPVKVRMRLRPLSFGTSDVKRLGRMILRGYFEEKGKSKAWVEWGNRGGSEGIERGSGYGEEMPILRGEAFSDRQTTRDIDSGMLARCKYRYYGFGYEGELWPDSEAESLEAEVVAEYDNEGMR